MKGGLIYTKKGEEKCHPAQVSHEEGKGWG